MYQLNLATDLCDANSEDEYMKNNSSRVIDHEAMIKGYQLMGDINLELASEGIYAENEAEEVISELLGED